VPVSRVILLISMTAIAGYFILKKGSLASGEDYLKFGRLGGNVLAIAVLVMLTLLLMTYPIPKKENVIIGLILPYLWIAAGAGLVLQSVLNKKERLWMVWPTADVVVAGLFVSQ